MGIEPTLEAWEAPVLPLNYTRRVLRGQEFTEEWGWVSPSGGRGMVVVGDEDYTRLFPFPFAICTHKKTATVQVAVFL